jgi:hypothetical protein
MKWRFVSIRRDERMKFPALVIRGLGSRRRGTEGTGLPQRRGGRGGSETIRCRECGGNRFTAEARRARRIQHRSV